MNIVIERGNSFVEMSCRSIAEVMGLAPEGSSRKLSFPVIGYEEDEAGHKVPCLGIEQMSDTRWDELTKQQVVKNYVRENGEAPESIEAAFRWQRQLVRELMER